MKKKANKYQKVFIVLAVVTAVFLILYNLAFNLSYFKLYLIFKVMFVCIGLIAILFGIYAIHLKRLQLKEILETENI